MSTSNASIQQAVQPLATAARGARQPNTLHIHQSNLQNVESVRCGIWVVGKVLLDATNPLTPFPGLEVGHLKGQKTFRHHRPVQLRSIEAVLRAWNSAPQVRWGQATSGGEVIAKALPETHVFKAFGEGSS